jgi:hypothetical protein
MTVAAKVRLCAKAPGALGLNRPASPRIALGHLSLARRVALIPALILLLLGLMLTVALQMGGQNTAALRALDRDVFEPLNRTQTLKDGVTLLHTRLFALLAIGNNETNPAAQKTDADAFLLRLDIEAVSYNHFLDANAAIPSPVASWLRAEFADYAKRVRETVSFAAYDASYGAMVVGVTDDKFRHLSADLDALVQSLAQRRTALATDAVSNSLAAQKMLLVHPAEIPNPFERVTPPAACPSSSSGRASPWLH